MLNNKLHRGCKDYFYYTGSAFNLHALINDIKIRFGDNINLKNVDITIDDDGDLIVQLIE